MGRPSRRRTGIDREKEERRKKLDFCVAFNINLSGSKLTMTSRGVVAAIPPHEALLIRSYGPLRDVVVGANSPWDHSRGARVLHQFHTPPRAIAYEHDKNAENEGRGH